MKGKREASPEETTDPLLKLVGILRDAIPEGAEAFLRELRRDKEPGETEDGETPPVH